MESSSEEKEKSSKLPLYITLGVVASLLAAYFFWPEFGQTTREGWQVLRTGDQDKISAWVQQFSFWGPAFIIAFTVLQMFVVVVNVVALIVIAVLAYGPVWGSLIAFAGIMLASCIGYALGRLAGAALVDKLLGPETAAKVEEQVHRYGVWAVVIARISPFLSNDAISFIAGSTRLPFLKFILATIGGILPLIALIAYLGEDTDRLKTGLIWVSVIAIVAFGIYYFYDRQKHKKAGGNPSGSGKR